MRYRVAAVDLSNLPVTGDRDEDVNIIITALNMELEKAVRQEPGQYLWGHRRWRDQSND